MEKNRTFGDALAKISKSSPIKKKDKKTAEINKISPEQRKHIDEYIQKNGFIKNPNEWTYTFTISK